MDALSHSSFPYLDFFSLSLAKIGKRLDPCPTDVIMTQSLEPEWTYQELS